MHRTRISQASAAVVVAIAGILLVGCPPKQYCQVTNLTRQRVRIDFTFEGSGTLLPHFTLMPGDSRRVTAGPFLTAKDEDGHIIGTLDISAIRNPTVYFDRADPYTFHVHITPSGIKPVRVR
jgi:hypothetical protein